MKMHFKVPPIKKFNKSLETTNLFLLFPGLNGPDVYTHSIMKKVKATDNANDFNRIVETCEWCTPKTSVFCASTIGIQNGYKFGKYINSLFANQPLNIHLVGISAGGFAADVCCKTLKMLNPQTKIHLTLLDPFLLHKSDYSYGVSNFGIEADFCEQYLNKLDPVPFTNRPITNAYVKDISMHESKPHFNAIKRKTDTLHSWSAYYYSVYWVSEADPRNYNSTHEIYPRGTIIEL
jgi:hypothetical protein